MFDRRKKKKWAKRNVVLSQRVLYVDVKIDKNKIRIIAYAPQAKHSGQDFAIFLEQSQTALHGAYKNGRRVILEGNLQIDVGI